MARPGSAHLGSSLCSASGQLSAGGESARGLVPSARLLPSPHRPPASRPRCSHPDLIPDSCFISQSLFCSQVPIATSATLSSSRWPTHRLRAVLSFRRSHGLPDFTSDFGRRRASSPRSLPRFSLQSKPAAAAAAARTEACPASRPPSGTRVPRVPPVLGKHKPGPFCRKGGTEGCRRATAGSRAPCGFVGVSYSRPSTLWVPECKEGNAPKCLLS